MPAHIYYNYWPLSLQLSWLLCLPFTPLPSIITFNHLYNLIKHWWTSPLMFDTVFPHECFKTVFPIKCLYCDCPPYSNLSRHSFIFNQNTFDTFCSVFPHATANYRMLTLWSIMLLPSTQTVRPHCFSCSCGTNVLYMCGKHKFEIIPLNQILLNRLHDLSVS